MVQSTQYTTPTGFSTVVAAPAAPDPKRVYEFEDFFARMDAANVDLKAFTEDFYFRQTGAHLAPVLETLEYIVHETRCWLEITTLLIPGHNDGADEIEALSRWVHERLGPDVPLHFTAFHPDYRMLDKQRTPFETLAMARRIARKNGVRHAYTGNVHDIGRQSSYCHTCGDRVVERDWYELGAWALDTTGACLGCGTRMPGVFDGAPGVWGRKRMAIGVR